MRYQIPDPPAGVQALRPDERTLVLRTWQRTLRLTGGLVALVPRLLGAIDGARTVQQVAAAAGVDAVLAERVAGRLVEAGVLSLRPIDSGGPGEVASGAGRRGTTVIGSGRAAELTADHLEGGGDLPVLRLTDPEALAGKERPVGAVAETDRMVLVQERPDPGTALAVDRYAAARGTTWSAAWWDGTRVVLCHGIRPGHTACFGCLLQRRRASAGGPGRGHLPGPETAPSASGPEDAPAGFARLVPDLVGRALSYRAETAPPTRIEWFDLEARRTDSSTVLRLPSCPHCSPGLLDLPVGAVPAGAGPGREPTRGPSAAPAPRPATDDVDAIVDALVGPAGPIVDLRVGTVDLAGARLWTSRCELGDLRRITAVGGTADWFDGEGRGRTRGEAVVTGIAEALERYAVCLAGAGARLRFGTAEEFAGTAVPHARFAGPDKQEWEEVALDTPVAGAGSPVGWLPARDLVADTEVLLPARLALGPYPGAEYEDGFRGTGTKGLAAHRRDEAAVLHGLCELAESDAFMITYLNRLPAPEIDIGALDLPVWGRLGPLIGQGGFTSVRAWDITTDWGIPAVLAAVEGTVAGAPYLTWGCAAAPDPVAAITKAVNEAFHTNGRIDREGVEEARTWTGERMSGVRGRREHKLLGGHPGYRASLEWLLRESEPVGVEALARLEGADPAAHLREALRRSSAAGLSVYALDLTPPDIGEATGFRVWRTVSPEAQPFALAPLRYLDSARLREVPVRLGYFDRPLRDEEFNRVPHPCP